MSYKVNLYSWFLLISVWEKQNIRGSLEEAELASGLHLKYKPESLFLSDRFLVCGCVG